MIRGQTLAVEQLEALSKGDIPPAILFVGPRGVGKRTSAIRFASKVAEIPVKRIERDNSVDVRVYDGANLKVDEARHIEYQLHWNPLQGKKRIVIIDNADEMSSPVYNTLLKILEEPPSTSLLILITGSLEGIPLTVKSRMHQVQFGYLTEDDVFEILTEDLKMGEPNARSLAVMSQGSMEKAMWGYRGFFREDISLVSGVLTSLRAGNLESAFVEVERWNDRETLLRRIYIAYLYFRDCFIVGTDRLFPNPGIDLPIKEATIACVKIEKTHSIVAANGNAKLAMDNLMLDLVGVFR